MSSDTDAGSPLSRRGLLKGMVTTSLASTLDPLTHALAELAPRQRDLITYGSLVFGVVFGKGGSA